MPEAKVAAPELMNIFLLNKTSNLIILYAQVSCFCDTKIKFNIKQATEKRGLLHRTPLFL